MKVSGNKHITFIDFIAIGHHETYLKQFVQCVVGMGYRVTIFYPDKNSISAWVQSELTSHSASVAVYEIPEVPMHGNNRFLVLRRWMLARKFLRNRKVKPDLVFFPWIDDFRFRKDHKLVDKFNLKWVEWFFPFKWSGLYLHPTHLRMADSIHNRFPGYDIDDVFKLKNCSSICILDEGVKEKLEEKIQKPVIRFPDFADDFVDDTSPITIELVKAANGRKIVLLIGALHHRKGLSILLKTAKVSTEKNWLFVFTGELFRNDYDAEELQEIERQIKLPDQNIFFYPRRIKDEGEFNSIIKVCDVLYAAYYNYPHTSNMLNKAAIFKKPLVVARGFYMDEIITQLKMGEVIDESNPVNAKKAIEKILETPGYINNEMLKGFETYRAKNSISKLEDAIHEVLRVAGLE
jgi:glycosyltransferase involved in cell wall biosynthesis